LYSYQYLRPSTILVFTVPIIVLVSGYLAYRASSRNPHRRSRILQSMLVSSIFMWTFLGASLALCTACLNQYADGQLGILTLILGSSLLASFFLAGTLFVLPLRFATSSLLARMPLVANPLTILLD